MSEGGSTPGGDGLGPERPTRLGLLLTISGIAVMVGLVLVVEPLRTGVGDALAGDTESLRTNLRDLGAGGVAITLGIALSHAVVFYPAEILDAAAGFVYGFWVGLPLVMAGWIANAVAAYWIGQHAARPALWRLFGHKRFDRYERAVARGGVTLLLAMRLIPIVPFSLFSYVAGAARVPMWRFIWTTAVGYIPITALFVYLGSQLDELSVTDPILLVGAVILVVLLLLAHRLRGLLADDERSEGDRKGAGEDREDADPEDAHGDGAGSRGESQESPTANLSE